MEQPCLSVKARGHVFVGDLHLGPESREFLYRARVGGAEIRRREDMERSCRATG